MVEDIVSLQPRAVPAFIADTQPAQALAPDLGVGILDIRSVYDWDGAPWTGLAGRTIAQEAALPAAQRPARFLRIEKAVSLPDRDTRNFDRQIAFGRAGNFMREILGYVPIEADGSVRVKVPANVAFNVSVLDANGRRIMTPNRVWQQLRPGEIGDCNGCYYAPTGTGATAVSHGRKGLFATANAGAGAGCNGETIAENKSLWNCGAAPYSAPSPSMNLVFNGAATGDADHQSAVQRADHADPDAFVLHHDLEQRLPQHHQLSAVHQADVVGGPRRRRRRYLHQLPQFLCARHSESGQAPGGTARSHR